MYDSKGTVSSSQGAIYETKIKFTTNPDIVKEKVEQKHLALYHRVV